MSDTQAVRVMVEAAWDDITLDLPAATPVADLKRRALALTHVAGDPDGFQVKYRGAQVRDESHTLADLGIVPNAHLIVLARRRRPVR